jgi:rhodanese-related sulfurtransferase
MGEAIGIGFFQFDNLVRNRIPFALVVDNGIDFSPTYSGGELQIIKNLILPLEFNVSVLEILTKLQARPYQTSDPIVFVCQSGEKSKKWASELEQKGFMNSYFLKGGFEEFLREFQELK